MNASTPTLTLAGLAELGPVGGSDEDFPETTNVSGWIDFGASVLSAGDNTSEFDVVVNSSDSGGGHVPYYQRLETYLVPCLFALIFIVGVIGGWLRLSCYFLVRNSLINFLNSCNCKKWITGSSMAPGTDVLNSGKGEQCQSSSKSTKVSFPAELSRHFS